MNSNTFIQCDRCGHICSTPEEDFARLFNEVGWTKHNSRKFCPACSYPLAVALLGRQKYYLINQVNKIIWDDFTPMPEDLKGRIHENTNSRN